MAVLQDYAPTTNAEEDEIDEFYGQVQSEIYRILKQDVLLVSGDSNAKVGNSKENKSYYFTEMKQKEILAFSANPIISSLLTHSSNNQNNILYIKGYCEMEYKETKLTVLLFQGRRRAQLEGNDCGTDH